MLYFKTQYRGLATRGKMMAKIPNGQRKPIPLSLRASSAAFEPAKAVIMYGEDVKA
jgi:hypothetical protein